MSIKKAVGGKFLNEEWTDSCLNISHQLGDLSIRAAIEDLREDLSRFHIWAVGRSDQAESDILHIKSKKHGSSLGYVFPIHSLDPDSDYCCHKLENSYHRIFSSVATIGALSLDEFDYFLECDARELVEGEHGIAEFFNPMCSIVVLGRENLASKGENESSIRMFLQERGCFFAPPENVVEFKPYGFSCEPSKNINVYPLPKSTDRLSERIQEIVSIAARQAYPGAAFLMYYQAIELFLEESFKDRMQKVINGHSDQVDAWELKLKVQKAVDESDRIRKLIEVCRKADPTVVSAMFSRGKSFLEHVGEWADDRSDQSEAAIFRRVRNIVVHKQTQFSEEGTHLLKECTYSLHEIVFLLVKNFSTSEPESAQTRIEVQEGERRRFGWMPRFWRRRNG